MRYDRLFHSLAWNASSRNIETEAATGPHVTGGSYSDGTITFSGTAGFSNFNVTDITGDGGNPGGSANEIQYNDGGTAFGGIALTQGSILSATDAGAPSVLASGTNGYALVADSTTTTGLNWAANSDANYYVNSVTLSSTNNFLTLGFAGGGSAVSGNLSTFPSKVSFTTGISIGGNTSAAGYIELYEDETDGDNYVKLKAPALGDDTTFTLPAGYPASSGYALVSTTAGVMSWAVNQDGNYYVTGGTYSAGEIDFSGTTSFPDFTVTGIPTGTTTATNTQTFTNKTWNGVAIGDTYISSATNWNDAYNNYVASAAYSAGTLTFTQRDGGTFTATGFETGDVTGGGTDNYVAHWTSATNVTGTAGFQYDADVLSLTSATANLPKISITNTTDDNSAPLLDFIKDRDGTAAASDDLGGIRFYGDDAGGTQHNFARIDVESPVVTAGSEDGSIKFRTTAAGTDNAGVMILSGANVGIGTAAPESKLHINGGAYLAQFSRGTGDFTLIQSDNTNNLIFASGTPSSNTEMMTINSTGTGIGTTTPKANLHIKNTDDNWESGLLLEHDNATTGWNFHPNRAQGELLIGYNADTSVALTSQAATAVMCIESGGNIGLGTTGPSYSLDVYKADADGNPTINISDGVTYLRSYISDAAYVQTDDALYMWSRGSYAMLRSEDAAVNLQAATNIVFKPNDTAYMTHDSGGLNLSGSIQLVSGYITSNPGANHLWASGSTLYWGSNEIDTSADSGTIAGTLSDNYLPIGTAANTIGDFVLGLHDSSDYSLYIGSNPSSTTDEAQHNTALGITALDATVRGDRNTAVGYNALSDLTDGNDNTAIGTRALASTTDGAQNTVVGVSGAYLMNGNYNTVIGHNAAYNATSMGSCVIIGREAGAGSTNTGDDNIFIGVTAGYGNTDADRNIGIGRGALYSNLDGDHNVALGYEALYTMDPASGEGKNIAIGGQAAKAVTTGTGNIGIGYRAAYKVTTTNNNIAIGKQAMEDATGAGSVISIGEYSGYNPTGSNNIFMGYMAGYGNATDKDAASNVGIGKDALKVITDGVQNVAIGHQAGAALTTANNTTALGMGAANDITSGTDGVYIGKTAGQKLTTQNYNVVIGADAANSATGIDNSVVIGRQAMGGAAATGDGSVTIGYQANYSNLSTEGSTVIIGYQAGYTVGDATTSLGGRDNVLIGYKSGYNLSYSSRNVAVGYNTLTNAGAASEHNVAIGYTALGDDASTLTGDSNIAIGSSAMFRLSGASSENISIGGSFAKDSTGTVGEYNISIGSETLTAMAGASSSNGNIALGKQTLNALTTGNNNIAIGRYGLGSLNQATTNQTSNISIGYQAGRYLTTGSYNVYIGQAGPSSVTAESNKLYIANALGTPLIAGDFSTPEVTINGYFTVAGKNGDGTGDRIIRSDSSSLYIQSQDNLHLQAKDGIWLQPDDEGTAGKDVLIYDYRGGTNYVTFDGGTQRVGIGTTSPDAKVEIISTTEQLRLTHTDASKYTTFTQGANDFTITNEGTGDDIIINPNDKVQLHAGGVNYATTADTAYLYIQPTGTDGGDGAKIFNLTAGQNISIEAKADTVIKSDGTSIGTFSSTGLVVTGTVSATAKSFNIEHPLYKDKRLVHGSLEGPEHGIYIRGTIESKEYGCEIELPEYWEAMCDDYTVQLTPHGPYTVYINEKQKDKVMVASTSREYKFDYYVVGSRTDETLEVVQDG